MPPASPPTTHDALEQAHQALGLDIGPATAVPGWYGEPLDLGLALDALFTREGRPSSVRPALPPETSAILPA